MRSTLLVIASVGVLGSAFIAYSAFQSKTSHHLKKAESNDPLRMPSYDPGAQAYQKILPGDGVWVSTYNETTGELKNRFRAAFYKPQKNGKIEVTNPVAEFYMPNHQLMRLIGKTGVVSMPDTSSTAKNSIGDFGGGSPTRGQIQDVTIQLFNMLPGSNPPVPDETIKTQNVQFDNATRLITTEAYDNGSGVMVPSDQVPVKMRSDSDNRGYDFDGRGLRLRWNDKDGRLDLLEVAHGEELIVKDTSTAAGVFGGTGHGVKPPPATQPVAVAAAAVPGTENPGLGGAATKNLTPNPNKPSPAPGTDPPAVPIPYVATFYDNVRITQGDDVLVTANQMDIDFISRQKQEPGPATAPIANAGKPANDGTHSDPIRTMQDPGLAAMAIKDARDKPVGVSDSSMPAPVTASSFLPATMPPTVAALPTTRPASPPVVIRWTGKLVMLSAQANRPKVQPGDAIVELNGDPVTVRRAPTGAQEGDDVRAARLVYHTADGSVKLVNSKTTPQVVISKLLNGRIDPQSTVTTGMLDYLADATGRKVAILTGPGHAAMPIETKDAKPDPAKPAAVAMMDTHWKSGAKVYFTGKGQDDQAIEHVELAGDVDVKHPQLALQSQGLSLYFEPPEKPRTRGGIVGPPMTSELDDAGGPPVPRDSSIAGKGPATQPAHAKDKPQQELKRVIATEAVHCVMANQAGKSQTIDCNNLDMHTARSLDGKFYAKQVDAHGAVHAFDGEQDLRADSVALTLRPALTDTKKLNAPLDPNKPLVATTQPAAKDEQSETAAVELEKMIARDNVLVTNKDGSLATGAELVVTTENGENHVRLAGAPTAMVVDAKKSTIIGPLITFEHGIAHVVGAGKMHLLQEPQDSPGKPRPIDVTWVDTAEMDGKGNRIDLLGNVSVTTIDADGAVSVAGGDRLYIDLIEKPAPATRPATQPTTRPTQKPQMADSMQSGMKDKEARTITIDGHAQVVSTLAAGDGTALRQFALYGPKIIYQLADSKEQPAHTLLVPSAGRMYVGDHRPPEKAKAPDKGDAGGDEAGGRGDTAFQWSKQLLYSESQHQATITGDVLVVHQPLGKQAEEDRINADTVTASFEPQARPATRPATRPTTQPATQPAHPAGPGESLQVKHLTADGHVVITRPGGGVLYANRVDFDPLTHWMFAHGTDNNPARYIDPDPKRSMAAREMQWNTETWNIKMSGSKVLNPR